MTAVEIINRLRKHGVEVLLVGDRLKLRAPAEPPREVQPLIEALRARKAEALGVLSPWPGPCYVCGSTCWWLHRCGGSPICGLCHPPAFPEHVKAWIPQAACGWRGPC